MAADVLLTVCLALAATSTVVTLRWALRRVDAIGRPVPFPVLSVALPAAAAAVCVIPVIRHVQLESRLASVAGQLAGREVTVRCETLGETFVQAHPERGYVRLDPAGRPEPHAVITHDTCDDLAGWIRSDRRGATDPEVVAVHVLTHEAMHMSGLVDEARAECAALQRNTRTAILLGGGAEAAQAISRRYLLAIHPALPENYRSAQCRPGGELDEHLQDPPWT